MTEPARVADRRPPRRLAAFQITKQHRRFVEFADAVRRHRYIGACYGAPGLGKTLSARTYAAADDWDRWELHRYSRDSTLPQSLLTSRTAIFTPYVTITARQLLNEVIHRVAVLSGDIERSFNALWDPFDNIGLESDSRTELLIIDEADRLKTSGLEQLRDFFDRSDLGLILIGMPGFDRNSPATRSHTAGSGSPTNISRSTPTTFQPCSPSTGISSVSRSTPLTPRTPKRPVQSPRSPAATSA